MSNGDTERVNRIYGPNAVDGVADEDIFTWSLPKITRQPHDLPYPE